MPAGTASRSTRTEIACINEVVKTETSLLFGNSPPLPTDWSSLKGNCERVGLSVAFACTKEANLLNFSRSMTESFKAVNVAEARVYPPALNLFTSNLNAMISTRSPKVILVPSPSQITVEASRQERKLRLWWTKAFWLVLWNCIVARKGVIRLPWAESGSTISESVAARCHYRRALHYRVTSGNQFVLYAVGWDGVDDGGSVVTDWLWDEKRE